MAGFVNPLSKKSQDVERPPTDPGFPFDKALARAKDLVKLLTDIWTLLILGLGGLLYSYFGNTHTSFEFKRATQAGITVDVSTLGPLQKMAYVRQAELLFHKLNIESVRLSIQNEKIGAPAGRVQFWRPAVILLNVDRLRTTCRVPALSDKPDRYTKDEIDRALLEGGATATVILYVQESSDVGLARHKVSRLINAEDLAEFLDRFLPDDIPEKTSC